MNKYRSLYEGEVDLEKLDNTIQNSSRVSYYRLHSWKKIDITLLI